MSYFPSVTSTSHVCTECKRPLTIPSGRKVMRMTCSAKCRKARERRMKAQHSAWIMALHELQQIRDALKRGEDRKHHRDCLIRLKDEINDLLLLANDPDRMALTDMLNDMKARRS